MVSARSTWLRALSLFVLLTAAASSVAQSVDTREDTSSLAQGAAMPSWVVPVLRLVSSTHVEPTTGVVVSDTGVVLVPAGFASEGDEIIVLDGGTDIVRHGRTARFEKEFFTEGLQALRVSGLRRNGAPFGDNGLEDGAQVHLAAFPPAEQIAEGAAPLNTAATVVVLGENGIPAISGETQLPNVTGVLLDDCGNLAGMSLAHDVQSMQMHPGTRYKWSKTLREVLAQLRIRPSPSICRAPEPEVPEPTAVEPETPEPEADPEPEQEEIPPPDEPDGPVAEAEEVVEEQAAQEEEFIPPAPEETLDLEILPPIETGEPEVEEEPRSSAWPWLIPAILLFAGGAYLHRRRKGLAADNEPAASPDERRGGVEVTPDEDEPLFSAPVMDSRLVLSGQLAGGGIIDVSCPVSSNAVNVVIGRSQADLRIDSLAVSRQHAQINGTAGALTLTDLGSNNGTSINGVPCLEGEVMYVEPGDTLTLGNARFTFELVPAESGPEAS